MPEGSNTFIEIPDDCLRTKNHFLTRPNEAFVRHVKAFIRDGGEPHLFPDHTHTRPPQGSRPVYLDTFDLPEAARKVGRLAPCPCCTPNDRKYGRNGKIAWFPQEALVRLMGPDCFAALDQEGHAQAIEELRRAKARRQNTRYLLQHHDRLRDAADVIEKAARVAQAIDTFAEDLTRKFNVLCNIPIWEYVKSGKLQVQEEFMDFMRSGDLKQASRSRDYASVRGLDILNPKRRDYPYLLNQSFTALSVLNRDGWDAEVAAMEDAERDKLARFISNTIKRSRTLISETRELQHFVTIENVNTIRAWGRRDDAPLRVHFEREGDRIRVGRSEKAAFTVRIPTHLEDELSNLDFPTLNEIDTGADE